MWRSTCALCASPGYTKCFDCTSVYFCASPMQNLAVPQTFIPLSVSVEWSGWPLIWWCGIGGFQEQAQCLFVGLVTLAVFVFNYFPFLFFSSIGWYCGAGVFGLIGCQSPSPSLALPIFFNNNNNFEGKWTFRIISYTLSRAKSNGTIHFVLSLKYGEP